MNLEHDSFPVRRRGRPCKHAADLGETRELLLRTGVELLTEQGFSATGIDQILRRVGVPKGSFYNYFKSKEAFGAELIERYRVLFPAQAGTASGQRGALATGATPGVH